MPWPSWSHNISFVNCSTGGRLSDQQTSLWSRSWGWGSSRGEKTPRHVCWYNKILRDIDIDVDDLENIDREINHLDNQKHLCRELLSGCTKPMVSTASSGPGRQYLNSSTSILHPPLMICSPFAFSSDNYIESAVRGDTLNFHLVIDIEWVYLVRSMNERRPCCLV